MKPLEKEADTTFVKCVVWDLDDTVWQGTLSEDPDVRLRDGVEDLVHELDRRGVLQSIASKNDPDLAIAKLKALGLDDYFLYPQFSWTAKSELVKRIAEALTIGVDTLLFIDDSPFERAEVTAETTAKVIGPDRLDSVLLRCDLPPSSPTSVGAKRRALYQDEVRRKSYEEGFVGPRAEFLKALDLQLDIRVAERGDLSRCSELTARTNQLNTTGLTFSKTQLETLSTDRSNTLLVISLRDVFGDYGVIGLVLLSEVGPGWRIRLFLMSCRVMGRNIGGAVLAYLVEQADQRGLPLSADFRHTDVNRQMYLVYRLAGFEDHRAQGAKDTILTLRPGAACATPSHVKVHHEALG